MFFAIKLKFMATKFCGSSVVAGSLGPARISDYLIGLVLVPWHGMGLGASLPTEVYLKALISRYYCPGYSF